MYSREEVWKMEYEEGQKELKKKYINFINHFDVKFFLSLPVYKDEYLKPEKLIVMRDAINKKLEKIEEKKKVNELEERKLLKKLKKKYRE